MVGITLKIIRKRPQQKNAKYFDFIEMQSTYKRWILKSLQDTINLGEQIPKDLPEVKLLTLQGPLGVGKTSLVKGIAKTLGIHEPVTSPTFTLSQHYLKGSHPLIHIDLYRLENPISANELFLQEEEEGVSIGALIVVEWPERLKLNIKDAWRIEIQYLEDGRRMAQMFPPSIKES